MVVVGYLIGERGGGVTVDKNRGRPELVISVGLKNLNIIRTKNYLS
jgi:hypothetical protein